MGAHTDIDLKHVNNSLYEKTPSTKWCATPFLHKQWRRQAQQWGVQAKYKTTSQTHGQKQ